MDRGKKILYPTYIREDDENKIPRNYQERVISDIEGFFVLFYIRLLADYIVIYS